MAKPTSANPARPVSIPMRQVRAVLEAFIPQHGPLSDQQLDAQALLATLPTDPVAMIFDTPSLAAALHQTAACQHWDTAKYGRPCPNTENHLFEAAAILVVAALRPPTAQGRRP
jgi:hypothetical protein